MNGPKHEPLFSIILSLPVEEKKRFEWRRRGAGGRLIASHVPSYEIGLLAIFRSYLENSALRRMTQVTWHEAMRFSSGEGYA